MEETTPRVVLVTGGAQGIGAAIAQAFAADGASVWILDNNGALAQETAGKLAAAGHLVRAIEVDVSRSESVTRAVGKILDAEGRVDVLCNNAGIAAEGLYGILDFDEDVWDRDFGVNAKGPFLMMKATVPGMIERGGGCVINIASVAGLAGRRGGAAYTASKHALVGLTKAVAATYGRQGIRCNAICPGGVDSGMQAGAPGDAGTAELVAQFRATMPQRGKPSEIASIAVFLAGEGAAFMNGSAIVADGGWTAP